MKGYFQCDFPIYMYILTVLNTDMINIYFNLIGPYSIDSY